MVGIRVLSSLQDDKRKGPEQRPDPDQKRIILSLLVHFSTKLRRQNLNLFAEHASVGAALRPHSH
jgi:hypothetical protein